MPHLHLLLLFLVIGHTVTWEAGSSSGSTDRLFRYACVFEGEIGREGTYTRRVEGIVRLINQRVYLIVYNLSTRDTVQRRRNHGRQSRHGGSTFCMVY